MSFFCPRCRASIPGEATQVIACKSCGLKLDLAELDTQHGQRAIVSPLPLVKNFTGEKLGRFELVEHLGLGGMGSVYKALDTREQTFVAVKILFPQLGDLEERFHREAQVLKELSHPNIVRFIEEGNERGVRFLVMEYVEGETLEHHLAQALPADEVREIVRQVAAALEAAHAKGIVHRDLKPANILLSKAGVKVVDFGVAHMAAHDFTLTQSDAVLGTFNYMAPEQRLRAKTIDARADIFSLATITYRMLTGTLPIGQYDPPSKMNEAIGTRFDAIVARALHPDPARRPQSATEFVAGLEAKRAWWPAAAALFALAAGGGGIVWFGGDTPAPVLAKDAPASAPVIAPQAPPPQAPPKEENLKNAVFDPPELGDPVGKKSPPKLEKPMAPQPKKAPDFDVPAKQFGGGKKKRKGK